MPAIVVLHRAAVAPLVVAGLDVGGQPALVVAGLGGVGVAQDAVVVEDAGLRRHTHRHVLGERGVADESKGGRNCRQESRPCCDDDALHVSPFVVAPWCALPFSSPAGLPRHQTLALVPAQRRSMRTNRVHLVTATGMARGGPFVSPTTAT